MTTTERNEGIVEELCSMCDGDGIVWFEDVENSDSKPCPKCGGTGSLRSFPTGATT